MPKDKLIKKIKSTDIKDFSSSSESSLYEDNRILFYKPLMSNTHIQWNMNMRSTLPVLFLFQGGCLCTGYNLSVQESELIVIVRKIILFRYYENNMLESLVVAKEGKTKKYRWEAIAIQEPLSMRLFSAHIKNCPKCSYCSIWI